MPKGRGHVNEVFWPGRWISAKGFSGACMKWSIDACPLNRHIFMERKREERSNIGRGAVAQ